MVEQLARAMVLPLALSKGELQVELALPAVALETFLPLWMEIWWPVLNLSDQGWAAWERRLLYW